MLLVAKRDRTPDAQVALLTLLEQGCSGRTDGMGVACRLALGEDDAATDAGDGAGLLGISSTGTSRTSPWRTWAGMGRARSAGAGSGRAPWAVSEAVIGCSLREPGGTWRPYLPLSPVRR